MRKTFSYELERGYYSSNWPQQPQPYLHLEPYLRCWLNPELTFTGKRILDIGAGEATYTQLIASQFNPKEIIASELFLERILPAVRSNRNKKLRFVVGDCFRLPFPDRSFDVVFGSLVLAQIPDLHAVIAEIRRVLVLQGSYIGIEPNPYHPVHFYRYWKGTHSPNQYLFGPKHVDAFSEFGFNVSMRYFWVKLPRLRSRFLGTCIGIHGTLTDSSLKLVV